VFTAIFNQQTQMSSPRPPSRLLVGFISAVCALSFLLLVHNYALNLLPRIYSTIEPEEISPDPEGSPIVFAFAFEGSTPDGPYHRRSRVIFHENGLPQPVHSTADVVRGAGRFNWAHEPGRILFASSNNTDPRINSCTYYITYPILYHPWIGKTAVLLFAASVAGLYWLGRPRSLRAPEPLTRDPSAPRWRAHLGGATLLFLAGLYLSTGTLTPYANTSLPHVDPATGYLYNPDHIHFRAMFDFVDGAERSTWHNALFLRRILYNVLAYPAMKAAPTWEIGGTLAAIGMNLAAFLYFLHVVRRRIGERGALFAAWCLALYPGAAYWVGLPYSHTLIAPVSLLLTLVLAWIWDDRGWRPLLLGSAALGIANLGYDFFVNFLPATVLLLAWQRRWVSILASLALQLIPLVTWILILKHGFNQDILNSNTGSFGAIAGSYLHINDFQRWFSILMAAPDIGFDIFFGSNFIFLPILFLVVIAVNGVTSRSRFHPSEIALLVSVVSFFLFNNLAPDYASAWQMRGTWIARLYQPVFPALILFCARWYQELPPLRRPSQLGLIALLAVLALGNALVIFGSIFNNPLRIAETAFYRFYDHANPVMFEINLRDNGRRPLGFPRPQE
jgi:hypothetical protein